MTLWPRFSHSQTLQHMHVLDRVEDGDSQVRNHYRGMVSGTSGIESKTLVPIETFAGGYPVIHCSFASKNGNTFAVEKSNTRPRHGTYIPIERGGVCSPEKAMTCTKQQWGSIVRMTRRSVGHSYCLTCRSNRVYTYLA